MTKIVGTSCLRCHGESGRSPLGWWLRWGKEQVSNLSQCVRLVCDQMNPLRTPSSIEESFALPSYIITTVSHCSASALASFLLMYMHFLQINQCLQAYHNRSNTTIVTIPGVYCPSSVCVLPFPSFLSAVRLLKVRP
jgi:hypothetical protein